MSSFLTRLSKSAVVAAQAFEAKNARLERAFVLCHQLPRTYVLISLRAVLTPVVAYRTEVLGNCIVYVR